MGLVTSKQEDSTYQPKGNYALANELNNYQPKGNYALANDLNNYQPKAPVGDSYTLKSYTDATYQPRGSYATLTDLDKFQPKGNYITSPYFDEVGKQIKGSFESIEGRLRTDYQPKGNYITSPFTTTKIEGNMVQYITSNPNFDISKLGDRPEGNVIVSIENGFPRGEKSLGLASFNKDKSGTALLLGNDGDFNFNVRTFKSDGSDGASFLIGNKRGEGFVGFTSGAGASGFSLIGNRLCFGPSCLNEEQWNKLVEFTNNERAQKKLL